MSISNLYFNYFNKNINKIQIEASLIIFEAARDYLYLLNRGYNRQTVLDMVTARYKLSKVERMILYRGIHPKELALKIKEKNVKAINDEDIIIDGFNTTSIIHSMLLGETLLIGNDGFVRDLARCIRKIKVDYNLMVSLALLLSYVHNLKPRKIELVFDSQISMSAKIANLARILLHNKEDKVSLVPRADKYLIAKKNSIVISSDILLLSRSEKIHDLAGELVRILHYDNIIDFNNLLDI